jgi:hypothetical protein
MKKGFTIFLIPEESGLPSMQFRISFASIVTGVGFAVVVFSVFFLMVSDLNTAADDDQMHSENLRIRSELDSMHDETRELQRQIELLQAYSLHIDISTEEFGTGLQEKKSQPTNKIKQNKIKQNKIKQKKTKQKKTTTKPDIYIEVKKEEISPPDKDKTKNEIFIDVSSEKNPSKKK